MWLFLVFVVTARRAIGYRRSWYETIKEPKRPLGVRLFRLYTENVEKSWEYFLSPKENEFSILTMPVNLAIDFLMEGSKKWIFQTATVDALYRISSLSGSEKNQLKLLKEF